MTVCTNKCRGGARDHSGAAGDVEHMHPRLNRAGVDQGRRPGTENVSGDVALVALSGAIRELPLLVRAHRGCQPRRREICSAAFITAAICVCGGEAGMYWIDPAIAIAPAYFPAWLKMGAARPFTPWRT